jgi:hypothetical protein
MNPSTKDETKRTVQEAIGNVKEKEGQATNNPDLDSEGKAVNLAISSSLFLAPRQELLEKEAEVKRETEEEAAKSKAAKP